MDGCERERPTSSASLSAAWLLMTAFMTPAWRSFRVSARVSMPSMAMIPWPRSLLWRTVAMLIPLLVLWLNSVEDGNFTIDAFELTNISIGGLFAVVGLNFTVNSSFVKLAAGDNPVMRLFALNYFLLGLSIALCILLYRFNVVKRVFGPHIQEEFYGLINWAIPLLVFGTATAIMALAIF